jgi:hypothetical protein
MAVRLPQFEKLHSPNIFTEAGNVITGMADEEKAPFSIFTSVEPFSKFTYDNSRQSEKHFSHNTLTEAGTTTPRNPDEAKAPTEMERRVKPGAKTTTPKSPRFQKP